MTRRVLLQKEMPNPFGLYFFEDRIYWSDYEKHTIQSANAQTGADRRLVRDRLEGINNIIVYHKQRPEGISPILHRKILQLRGNINYYSEKKLHTYFSTSAESVCLKQMRLQWPVSPVRNKSDRLRMCMSDRLSTPQRQQRLFRCLQADARVFTTLRNASDECGNAILGGRSRGDLSTSREHRRVAC